jgi:predicted DNA binding protein
VKVALRQGDAPNPQTLVRLRRRAARGEEPYAVYRLALELPRNAVGGALSRIHRELRIEVANWMNLPTDLLLLDVRVFGPSAGDHAEEVRQFAGVMGVEVHKEGPETAMYRVVQRRPVVMKLIQHHQVLARYPITIQDGWIRFETIAKASQVRTFIKDATRRMGAGHVEAVHHGPVLGRNLGLTDAQDALFRAALSAGYFNSPRGISISDLAERLGRSKSSTSEMLSKIQRRLAETAVRFDLAPLVLGA